MVAFIALAAGTLFLGSLVLREYAVARDSLTQEITLKLSQQPNLQASVYFDDRKALEATLNELLEMSDAIRQTAIRDIEGDTLATAKRWDSGEVQFPPVDRDQNDFSVAESKLHTLNQSDASNTDVLLSQVGIKDKLLAFTVPISTSLNPNQTLLTLDDFQYAIANPDAATSLHVIAYVQTGISRNLLFLQQLPKMVNPALGTLAFILFSIILGRILTRRITAPFSTIVRMADDIAAGRPVESKGLERSGEFKEVASLLNAIIGGLNTYKAKMDVDHQLLSMKVEERTSQLSRRNEELNKAVKEVTETKDRLRKLAYYDSLTSLPNRRLFGEQLDLLLRMSKRSGDKMALLFLDLDNFKRINDSLGHSAGDILLREVAKRLSHCVRESDLVAHYASPDAEIDVSRLGGDEFTVVLSRLEAPKAAGLVAQRVIDTLIEPITLEGHEVVVTPSIGIAIAPDDANNVEELLKAADTAMYSAKSTGKNGYKFYTSDMEARGVELLTLETELRKAIERNELRLHYQPQVDTATGTVVGAEALMRWEHPERGLVPPFKFIPLAEELGMIGALGEWGLEEACRQLMELQNMGLSLPKVSVNVSALQFDHQFIKRVGEVISETGIHPSRLELELTEGIMMDGTDSTIHAFQSLRDLGVQLSVDDFGTGYSSLSYLSRFPLNELKIDRSFVIDFDKSENDTSLVVAIIAMARSLRLNLVAEGVETHDQYRFLRENGASVIQGYLFSKPVTLEELKPMLAPGYFLGQIAQIDAEQATA